MDAAGGGARVCRSPGEVDPCLGSRSHLQHDRESPRLVRVAPACVGRADSCASIARRAARRS